MILTKAFAAFIRSNLGSRYEAEHILTTIIIILHFLLLPKLVRCFGTEGRGRGTEVKAEEDKVYDYVVFSAADIRDLHVHHGPSAGVRAGVLKTKSREQRNT